MRKSGQIPPLISLPKENYFSYKKEERKIVRKRGRERDRGKYRAVGTYLKMKRALSVEFKKEGSIHRGIKRERERAIKMV